MKQYDMNMNAGSALPPFVPSTVSIFVSGSPVCSATNLRQSSHVRPMRHFLSTVCSSTLPLRGLSLHLRGRSPFLVERSPPSV